MSTPVCNSAPVHTYEVTQDIAALGARVWDVIVVQGDWVLLHRKYRPGCKPKPEQVWAGDQVAMNERGGIEVWRFYAGDVFPLLGLYHAHLTPHGDSVPPLHAVLVERAEVLAAPRLTVSTTRNPKPSRQKKRPALQLVQGGAT